MRPKVQLVFIAVLVGAALLLPRPVAAATLSLSATVLSKNICRFVTTTATLPFGTLDPSNAVDITATATLTFRCQGSTPLATFLISDDDGLYETGANANRMVHAVDAAVFMAYNLSYTPTTATVPRLTNQTLTVTGTLPAAAYATAIVGSYSDTVVLSINP